MAPDSGSVRVMPIVRTSLNEAGEFDVDSIGRLLQALVVLGAPRDVYSLTDVQMLDVVRVFVWQVRQRVTILAGGSYHGETTAALAKVGL